MKNKIIFLSFILFLLTAVVAFSNTELERLDNSDFQKPQRPGAVFEHDGHNEMAGIDDCNVCHHVYEGKKLVEDESSEDSSCADCHSLKAVVDNSITLELAYHKRCKNCHFEQNKGPVLCGECHIK
ncbi:MAG: acidic cytochrome c TcmA [Deltaproteobacteria bacterium]|nr:MAG: acidic cytochrome c TcmA [Deltaproteobacteria bacterium]